MSELAEFVGGTAVVALTLWDVTRTVVVTSGPAGWLRFSRHFHRMTWVIWQQIPARLPASLRERGLSFYAPLSLLLLLASWVFLLMVGWWLIFLGAHSDFGSTTTHTKALNPQVLLYFSGTSLLTIGFGDVVATSNFTRGLALAEAFTGLATLALVISYLPALYGAYNRREALIFTLDRVHAPTERTGAIEVLPLLESFENYQELREFFIRWEYWIAELMESHVSFPVLAYFRSQNEERSWLAALALVLNLSTLLLAVDPSTDSKAPYWLYRRGVQALREILVQLHLPPRNTDLDASVVEARQSLLAQRESYFQKTLYPVLRGHARDPGSVVGATVAWESVERFRGDYWPQVETLRHYLRFQANIFARRLD